MSAKKSKNVTFTKQGQIETREQAVIYFNKTKILFNFIVNFMICNTHTHICEENLL